MKTIYLNVKSISFFKVLCNEILEMQKCNGGNEKVVKILIDEFEFLNWEIDTKTSSIYQKSPIVVARKGDVAKEKIVVTANMFLNSETLGQSVNGGGLVAILLLAELLNSGFSEKYIEFVVFEKNSINNHNTNAYNEDKYLSEFNNTILNIDINVIGVKSDETILSISSDKCGLKEKVDNVLREFPEIKNGADYPNENNTVFIENGISAISVLSNRTTKSISSVAANCYPCNDLENLDCRKIVDIARIIHNIVLKC
jgi:hypothetical protein